MSVSRAVAQFTRPGGMPEPASESDAPTFATSVLEFGGIAVPRGGRK
ncbi:MAG TPA: hypothetical protein VGF80_07195 [Galbitalea sp.]|jgi:hypothetical protein